jgi:hypothetical protein
MATVRGGTATVFFTKPISSGLLITAITLLVVAALPKIRRRGLCRVEARRPIRASILRGDRLRQAR